jgi:hypothetical protein
MVPRNTSPLRSTTSDSADAVCGTGGDWARNCGLSDGAKSRAAIASDNEDMYARNMTRGRVRKRAIHVNGT